METAIEGNLHGLSNNDIQYKLSNDSNLLKNITFNLERKIDEISHTVGVQGIISANDYLDCTKDVVKYLNDSNNDFMEIECRSNFGNSNKEKSTRKSPQKVFFMRHGQALHNVTHDSSISDAPLTEIGMEQAKAVAVAPWDHPAIELVVASPLTRALQTTLLAFGHLLGQVPFLAHSDVQEIGVSKADTGKPKSVISREFNYINFDCVTDEHYYKKIPPYTKTDTKPRVYTIVEEGRIALQTRLARFTDWLQQRPENVIVVVCHHGVLCNLLGVELYNAEIVETSLTSDGRFVAKDADKLIDLYGLDGQRISHHGSPYLSSFEESILKSRGEDVLAISKALHAASRVSFSCNHFFSQPPLFAIDKHAREVERLHLKACCSSFMRNT